MWGGARKAQCWGGQRHGVKKPEKALGGNFPAYMGWVTFAGLAAFSEWEAGHS